MVAGLRLARRVGPVLQRSPDLAVGDGPPARSSSTRPTSFNGAPTSRSGMVREGRRGAHHPAASTEPRPRGRGWVRVGAALEEVYRASTEPRPRGRGWSPRKFRRPNLYLPLHFRAGQTTR